MPLKDAGAPNDDPSYGGEVASWGMDYARQKYREFQTLMNLADTAYQEAQAVWVVTGDPALADAIAQYDQRAYWIKGIAETMQAAAAVVNASGGRMPALSIPGTLGMSIPPLVLPLAVVAALATFAEWVAQFVSAIKIGLLGAYQTAEQSETAGEDPPTPGLWQQIKTAARTALDKINEVERVGGGIGTAFSVVKWGAIAVLAFMAYRAIKPMIEKD